VLAVGVRSHRPILSDPLFAATLFVIGCVGFYRPMWYVESVTSFLVGSVLFLLSALGHALVEHGPST
jgi:hypothetical protein